MMLEENMKGILVLALTATTGLASAMTWVSVYDFNNTLDDRFDRDGFAAPLEFRQGGSTNTAVGAPPSYSAANVNGVTKQVAAFDNTPNAAKFFRATHGMDGNGGGAGYVNRYTIMMDLNITNTGWASIFNTNATNSNDGDLFIRDTDSALGISGVYAGLYPRNSWARLVVTVDSTPGVLKMKSYVNGVLQNTNAMDGLDGRWALYSRSTSTKTVDILADNTMNGSENGAGFISQLAFADQVLTDAEVAQLGGAGAVVPEPATMAVVGLGLAAFLRRRKK